MKHLVLLGDSVFDNSAYVGNQPDVISHLKKMIASDWKATLKAVDGNLAEDVSRQLREIPPDATHFIVSVGGNNAIMNADILSLQAKSSAEVFNQLADRVSDFEYHYKEMLKTVLSKNIPTAVCTVYYPNFPDEFMQKIAVAALCAFNDVIIRQAAFFGVPILDLRVVCNEPDDYANEIEPSGKGGQKIAAKILSLIENHDFSLNRTAFYF